MTGLAHTFNPIRLFLFGSLVCFAVTLFLIWQRYTPLTLTFQNFPQASNSYAISTNYSPVALSIRELDIHLPVIPGHLEKNRWPVSSQALIHLADTPKPGHSGNSIIYGHNWPNMLGNLSKARAGQTISLMDSQGQAQEFIITRVSIVTPDQTELLLPTSSPTLTLYTCTGFLDTLRLVVTANLIEV